MKQKPIPYNRPFVDAKDVRAISEVLVKSMITSGPEVEAFENDLCEYTGAKYCSVVSSGTAALDLTSEFLKYSFYRILTTPISFISTYSCFKRNFKNINFGFIDNNVPNLSVKQDLNKYDMIVATDMAGYPIRWDVLREKVGREPLLIRDACHSLGSKIKQEKTGSCAFADVTVTSFHAIKGITTGEGGAVFSNDEAFDKEIKSLRNHGIVKNEELTGEHGRWFYDVNMGYDRNYRLTDFQCALGRSQLKKLDSYINRRSDMAREYDKRFKDISGISFIKNIDDDIKSSHHLYILKIDFSKFKINKKQFFELMWKNGIQCQVHYIPIPYFVDKSFENVDPVTKKYYDSAVSIPLYPSMGMGEIERVVRTVKEVLELV